MTVTAEVEISFAHGKRTIQMAHKKTFEIEDCQEGLVVVLKLTNGESYTGVFKGMSGEEIMLGSLTSNHVIGLDTEYVGSYFEEINPDNAKNR